MDRCGCSKGQGSSDKEFGLVNVRVFQGEDPVPAVGRRHWALFVSSFQVDAFAYELAVLPEVIRVYLPLDCLSSGQGGSDYVFRVTPGFEELVGPELT